MKGLLAASGILAAVGAVFAADSVDRVSRTIVVSPAMAIRIDATIADLIVTGSDRPDLSVDIVRRAPSSADLATFPAVVDEEPHALHVAVVQAHEGRDPHLKAAITIAAPATAEFQAIRVFEGRVTLTNLRRACDVDLRRGTVDATHVAGRVRLEAGIGGIEVRDSDLTPGGMMRLRVFNGPLHVAFTKPPANGRILAVTFNGRLSSDIPLTMKDEFGPRFGETTLGNGDPVMSADVVKGDIAITVAK